MGYKVFVSHTSKDYEIVESIQEAAKGTGIAIWTYEQDETPGEELPSKLISKIEESDAIIALLTKKGAKSPAVNQEVGAAKAAKKLIIPIVEPGVDPSKITLLQGIEYLVLDKKKPEKTLKSLTAWLSKLKNKKTLKYTIISIVIIAVGFLLLKGGTRAGGK